MPRSKPPETETRAWFNAQMQRNADAQPLTTYCNLCPGRPVVGEGNAGDARAAALAHRTSLHPETIREKARRPNRVFIQKNMTREREIEIEEQRRQRRHMLGIG